jgi:hypothetical protein
MASNIVRFDAIRTIALADITSSFKTLGSSFGHAMRVLHFINNTNGDMAISFDGTTINTVVLSNSFSLYDLTSDEDANEMFRYELGTQVYVKYLTAPTLPATGTVYLVAIYGKGE